MFEFLIVLLFNDFNDFQLASLRQTVKQRFLNKKKLLLFN